MGTGFAVVSNVSQNKISCILNNLDIVIDVTDFRKSWTGILLLAEPEASSTEPNYTVNRKEAFIKSSRHNLFASLIIIAFILGYINNSQYINIYTVILAIINLGGLYTSYLLVLKQLHIHNTNADKICSIFKEGNCNDILDTDAAKLFGILSWSEIGLGYFASNLILLAFAPHLILYLMIINILTLPYGFWSIWYQKYKAKRWCPLCVIVQLILWAVFVTSIFSGYIALPVFTLKEITVTGLLYIIPTLFINALLTSVIDARIGQQYKYAFNSIKFADEVFDTMLSKQPYYVIGAETSKIVFGNPSAKTRITIFSNPHCNPCARMHKKVHKLLCENERLISVQYIFCSFGPELVDDTKQLLAIYLSSPKKAALVYDEWFENGKSNVDEFLNKFGKNINASSVQIEYAKHIEWAESNNMSSTPTVFINGYLLPGLYDIDDLKFI